MGDIHMDLKSIGQVICSLRKEKGITQEELGKAVGVSMQAVSKWENGGVPDIELLPAIADHFNITVDTLFRRESVNDQNIEKAVWKYLMKVPEKDRFGKVYELCWVITHALADNEPYPLDDVFKRDEAGSHSQVINDSGYTEMRISRTKPYFLICLDGSFEDCLKDDHLSLFASLANKDFFNALVFLYKRTHKKPFTVKLLTKHLGFDENQCKEVIKKLLAYHLIDQTELELDDEAEIIYGFSPNPAFISLLIFAQELIDRPYSFWEYSSSRIKPFLHT
jgi:transcriptional regulator with XRE-family HTH domain